MARAGVAIARVAQADDQDPLAALALVAAAEEGQGLLPV
jgi:hypothetical protein